MRLELLILTGPDAGRRLDLGPAAMVLGRSPEATLPFPNDTFLSGSHVQLLATPDGKGVQVLDLHSTNGTFLNGTRVDEAYAFPGDVLRMGSLNLRVVPVLGPTLEGDPVFSEQPGKSNLARDPAVESVIGRLTSSGTPLFCVVDAAADPTILQRLQSHPEQTLQSLYEGASAQNLAPWAPYLVSLPSQSPLLHTLLGEGWGKAWASFCTTHVPFSELRRHLRRFLMVQLEDGPEVYFRFYDPRVLREFLPTVTHAELLHFFGPVQEWLFEATNPGTLLRSRCTGEGLVTEALPVGSPDHYTTGQSA